MSWCVNVIGTPEVNEPTVSMCYSEGNLAMATENVGFEKLPHIKERETALLAISKVIEELDKNNEGVFNDAWCVECDMKWSKGKEMKKSWEEWKPLFTRLGGIGELGELNLPFSDEKTCWGNTKRNELRATSVRFYLYYKSGYEVIFKW